uniref:FAS1 domain-containing protein n=1 Tax=Glossina brevipalpis TaxID=37001 RepID=A0A1A9WMV0_9MUSC
MNVDDVIDRLTPQWRNVNKIDFKTLHISGHVILQAAYSLFKLADETFNDYVSLKLHKNATDADPSVNPNPNAWEFLQNIEYYQYGKYYNISEFRQRIITCAMEKTYEDGEERTFFIPTNDAFKTKEGGNHKIPRPAKIERYHIDRDSILQHIVEGWLVFPRYLRKSSTITRNYVTGYRAGYYTKVRIREVKYSDGSYYQNEICWERRSYIREYIQLNCVNSNSQKTLHQVFVSNGVIVFTDSAIGYNTDSINKMVSKKIFFINNSNSTLKVT